MKITWIFTSILSISTVASALPPVQQPNGKISRLPDASSFDPALSNQLDINVVALEKRRGGGGGRGGGSGRGSGGSSGGSRPVSSYSFSPQSNLGGRTIDGSGTRPTYGGAYYGGAAVPYTAGQRSPSRSSAPFLLPIAAVGFFPGIWLYSVYAYPYTGYGYHWYDGNRNRTANVTCLCQEYGVCGCDPVDPNNQTAQRLLAQQITNGSDTGAPVNTTTARLIESADNNTIYINGTLENGTTAPGGTEPSNESQISAAAALIINYGGYWVAAAIATMFITVA